MFQPDHAAPGASAPSADEQRKHWRDYVVAQDWGHFTPEEHGVWDILFARQVDHLDGKVVSPFLGGIGVLGLDRPGIPDLDLLNQRLEAATGWRCVSVPGLVPDEAFFAMLAERAFPIGNFIRSPDSLDYLEEPDCFHDIFGHVPLIAHAPVARLMEAMGRLGVEAVAAGLGEEMSRLYWHTVEFGLAREGDDVRILGAGLVSSFGEAHFSLEADVPRPRFTLVDAARTPYHSDRFQPLYFVSDSLEQAAADLESLDLGRLAQLAA